MTRFWSSLRLSLPTLAAGAVLLACFTLALVAGGAR